MAEEKKDAKDRMMAVPLDQVRRARGEGLVALPRSKVASLRAFRRIRADRIFGIAGATFVIIGIILMFVWAKPPVVEKKFGVAWPQTIQDLGTESVTLTPGGSQEHTYNVDMTNVTGVTFWVTWVDDVAGPGHDQAEGDLFNVTVEGPDGSANASFSEQRTGGRAGMNMSFTLPQAGIPDIAAVGNATDPIPDEEAARERVGDRTNRTGTGTWTITVRLVSAGSAFVSDDARNASNGACPATTPLCTADTGNEYTIHFEYARYTVEYEKLF